MLDFSQLTPADIERDGQRSFAAGGLARYFFGEGDRYIVDIRDEKGQKTIVTVFDRTENKTVYPAPRRTRSGPATVRRLAWKPGGRTAGTIRITAADLDELLRQKDVLERDGHLDIPIRVERI